MAKEKVIKVVDEDTETAGFFASAVASLANEYAGIVEDGVPSADIVGYIDTGCYILNAQISGSIYGGMPSNKTLGLAGESSTGKTFVALGIVKYFLDQHPTGGCMYFESESAVSKQTVVERGIDARRMAIIPVSTVQEFRTQCLAILTKYEAVKEAKRPPLLIVLDSLGQLSTTKEIEDSLAGKEVKDMTKAALVKGLFRVLDLKTGKLNVPMIITNHIYSTIGLFSTKVTNGGSGFTYAADQIVFLGKSKLKDGTDVIGNILKSKLKKSRLTREETEVETKLSFETGLDRYYGLHTIALKYGIISKIGNKYSFPNGETCFEKAMFKDAERWFTKEILDQIDVVCGKEFCYGNSIDLTEE
jgi:RecA/RadA recombinase